jgi:hypothetical protein
LGGRKSSCDADIPLLSDAVKILNTHASASTGDRERQMQAARTIRRAAEIEMLVEERNEDASRDVRGSVWNDPNFEPPAASMGNAVLWHPQQAGGAAGLVNRGARERDIPSGATPRQPHKGRRPPTCSCCSQVRSVGHVRTCTHPNKVCSNCKKAAGGAAAAPSATPSASEAAMPEAPS